jgi:hypothetical protein
MDQTYIKSPIGVTAQWILLFPNKRVLRNIEVYATGYTSHKENMNKGKKIGGASNVLLSFLKGALRAPFKKLNNLSRTSPENISPTGFSLLVIKS